MNSKMFDGNDLPHELLLTAKQKTKLRNAFSSNMSTDLKLSKTHISKIIQSGGFLGPLGITATVSSIDAGIQKKIHGSGTTTLIISNEEVNDITKVVRKLFLKILIFCWKESLKQLKEQKGDF